uniref:Beta-N-acetylhexosaminidase n=1 Tax=Strongyloides stercoralis TaxID=6248 RepID=A0A0K0EKQ9_STRER
MRQMVRLTKKIVRVLTFGNHSCFALLFYLCIFGIFAVILSETSTKEASFNQMRSEDSNNNNNNNYNNNNNNDNININFIEEKKKQFNFFEKGKRYEGNERESENRSKTNYKNNVTNRSIEKNNVEKSFNDNDSDNQINRIRKNKLLEREKQEMLEYPLLSSTNTFIPSKRYIHLDLKGGVYRISFYRKLFEFFKKIGSNGILLEWEDVFPYEDKLADAVSGEAYTLKDVESIIKMAVDDFNFEVIPLVQTFGHLEWILKLKKFSHLKESPRHPQTLCIGKDEAFEIVKSMIDQVGKIHNKYGMRYFHMGADEVFQIGICSETNNIMNKNNYDVEKVMLWHIKRVAEYVKSQYNVSVLIWHDMLVQVPEDYLIQFKLTELVEPVLWSYAENLDYYLPFQTWLALKPFKKVWGASAFKGADGPQRYTTNAQHYIRNHESWIKQMTNVYRHFDKFQGLFFCGWSRYDHMALLSELIPISLPTLAYSMETIIKGEPLNNRYPISINILGCNAPITLNDFVYGCTFPGHTIYETINDLGKFEKRLTDYFILDHEYGGWMNEYNMKYKISQPMREEKNREIIGQEIYYITDLSKKLRIEMEQIYSSETVDEFLYTHARPLYEKLTKALKFAEEILKTETFPKRPFVEYKEL